MRKCSGAPVVRLRCLARGVEVTRGEGGKGRALLLSTSEPPGRRHDIRKKHPDDRPMMEPYMGI